MNSKTATIKIFLLVLFVWPVTLSCSGDSDIEDIADALQERLDNALPGDIVEAESGSYEGPFTIPEGVTLKAIEPGEVILISKKPGFVVELEPYGEFPTAIDGCVIESETGSAALIANGAGEIALANLDVKLTGKKGVGILLQGLSKADLQNISVDGMFPENEVMSVAFDGSMKAKEYPVLGLGAVDVDLLVINELKVERFLSFGLLALGGVTEWTGGSASRIVGTAVIADNVSEFHMTDVNIEEIWQGARLEPPMGVVLNNGGAFRSSDLKLSNVEGIGIFQGAGVLSQYKSLEIINTKEGIDNRSLTGLWIQDAQASALGPSAAIISGDDGSLSVIESVGESAITAMNVSGLVIQDTELRLTENREVFLDAEVGTTSIGDGLHLVGSTKDVSLKNVSLVGNERVGIRLEAEGAALDTMTAENVSITGVESDEGLIGQNGVVVTGMSGEDTFSSQVSVDTLELAEADMAVRNGELPVPKVNNRKTAGQIMNSGLIGTGGLIGENGLVNENGVIEDSRRIVQTGLENLADEEM